MYNIACCQALLGDAGQAIHWLERAVEAGFDNPVNLIKDSDFDPIRSDAAFQRFIDDAFAAAGIERKDPEHYPYRTAMARFDEMKAADSTDGKEWYHVGYQMIRMGETDRAVEAFTRAVDLLPVQKRASAMYNLACSQSLAGDTRSALEWLDRAVEAGFDQHERFLNDTDLEAIRGTREFERIAKKSEFLSLGRFPRREWDESDYSADRWAPAVEDFSAYVAEHPDSGRGWFDLGWALHFSRRHGEAASAFENARDREFRPGISSYNLACANALLGRSDAALDALERAVELGAVSYDHVRNDEDLESLRSEARFQQILEKLEEQQRKMEQSNKLELKKIQEFMEQLHEQAAGIHEHAYGEHD